MPASQSLVIVDRLLSTFQQKTTLHNRTCESVVTATMKAHEDGKFDPLPPKNPQPIVTKISVRDYFGDSYQPAKFYSDWIRGFISVHA